MIEKQPPAPQFGEPPMRVRPYSAADDSLGWCLVSKDAEGHDITVAVDIQDPYAVSLAERYNALAGIPDPQAFVREVRDTLAGVLSAINQAEQEGCIDHLDACDDGGDFFYEARNRAYAMLARLDAGRWSK